MPTNRARVRHSFLKAKATNHSLPLMQIRNIFPYLQIYFYIYGMIKREIEKEIKRLSKKFPVISITGPRQSGKTTVTRLCFPKHMYLNLELPELQDLAFNDPRAFLNQGKGNFIIDEAQYAPALFSYIQSWSDENKKMGQFVISGSQHFLMFEKISQSLAGRTAVTHLLPFSIGELKNNNVLPLSYERLILKGFYPPVYDRKIKPSDFYPSYISTYVQRDVRQITGVHNLLIFQKFLSLCAGRTGQVLNYVALGTDAGIDQKTAMAWLSILETSFIIYRVPAYHNNFNKRIIKAPKLYFHDVGLAAHLLGIQNEKQLNSHFHKGALFENMIISDIVRTQFNKSILAPVYYWRDSAGHEIDCIIDEGGKLKAIEIKSGTTIRDNFFDNLRYFKKTAGPSQVSSCLIYGGNLNSRRNDGAVIGWKNIEQLY